MPDVLIRGMEMPKEWEKILIAADGSVWVNAWPTRGYMRMENVYAVPLPEGHGRLIDADELMNRARGCLDGLTILSLEFLVNGSSTIVPAEGGTDDEHV